MGIYVDYIPEMVKKLQNVNNTESVTFDNGTSTKTYSVLNHYKILIDPKKSRSTIDIKINHLVPNTQYIMYFWSTTETPDSNVQKNNITKIIATTRNLAKVKEDFYLDPSVYK